VEVTPVTSDVLSQSEIDALLAALTSGEMSAEELKREQETRKVKPYDFKRALRFSKDQIRSLARIHETFARSLTTLFSAMLRTFVQFSVVSVDQLPYDEFVRSIPNQTVLNVFEARPLEGRMVLEVNPNVAYAMLDRLLGGRGKGMQVIGKWTEIEMSILQRLFSRALSHLPEAWKNVLDLDVHYDTLEVNAQFIQIVSPNDTVAVITFRTVIGDTSGMMNLCLPHIVLEPVMPKLSSHHWLSPQKKQRPPEQAALQRHMKRAAVPVVAELGTATITLRDLLQLAPGDCIVLDQSPGDPIVVKVGKIPKFVARPGTHRGRLAVQIEARVKGEDADD